MKQIAPAIIVYIVSGLIYIFSALMGYDYVVFLTKPIIASSMMFHYCNEVNSKVNFLYLLVLVIYFLSGILNLFEDSSALQYVMGLNLIAYTILLSNLIKVILKINFNHVDNINVLYIILTLIFLASLVYIVLFLVFDSQFYLYGFMVVYAIVLTILAASSTIVYTLKPFTGIVYLMIASYCYVICDLFYAIFYYAFDYPFFRIVSIIASVVSYYFLVNYFLLTSKKKKYLNYSNEFN